MTNLKKLAAKVAELKAKYEAKKRLEREEYLRYCSGYEQYSAPVPDFKELGF